MIRQSCSGKFLEYLLYEKAFNLYQLGKNAEVLLQSSKMNNTSLTLAIVYAGIPNNIFISVQ
ncbi:hypothetical protein WMK_02854, partial [Enterococcus faecalis ATCC 35038]|uniref:hypothetical protein n=1 Tax=Enterococcus faecalis TaxID=1351 RepID=UPI00032DAA81